MIHGQPYERHHRGPALSTFDWTNGCIAVTNPEIEEICASCPTARRSRSSRSREVTRHDLTAGSLLFDLEADPGETCNLAGTSLETGPGAVTADRARGLPDPAIEPAQGPLQAVPPVVVLGQAVGGARVPTSSVGTPRSRSDT